MGNAQEAIDTKAIEIACELKGSFTIMNDVLQAHLISCEEERRKASQQREAFRSEVAMMFGKFEAKNDTQHAENRSSLFNLLWACISGMGVIIMLLLGIGGYLFAKANGW